MKTRHLLYVWLATEIVDPQVGFTTPCLVSTSSDSSPSLQRKKRWQSWNEGCGSDREREWGRKAGLGRGGGGAPYCRVGGERHFSFSTLIWEGSTARRDKRRKRHCPSPITGKGQLGQSLVSGIQASKLCVHWPDSSFASLHLTHLNHFSRFLHWRCTASPSLSLSVLFILLLHLSHCLMCSLWHYQPWSKKETYGASRYCSFTYLCTLNVSWNLNPGSHNWHSTSEASKLSHTTLDYTS